MTGMKRSVALSAAVVVFHADVVIAWVCAAVFGIVAYGVMDLPLLMVAVMALVVGLGVWVVSAPLCGGWMWRWSGRVRRWGAPDTVYWPPAPVDHVAALLAPKPAPALVAAPKSRSTEPRPLTSYELTTWMCPWCEQPAVEGTHAWEDRGPFQMLSNHTFMCGDGHRWRNSTDGG
ncbi:hypothetical protein WKI65_44425 [Streptomyces sp. MS1.AVA.3]|uniref:hypothetical protein n=1 Tax=Streptomyces decoyicus TaxID=249567 RepID=UPI0030BDCBCB